MLRSNTPGFNSRCFKPDRDLPAPCCPRKNYFSAAYLSRRPLVSLP